MEKTQQVKAIYVNSILIGFTDEGKRAKAVIKHHCKATVKYYKLIDTINECKKNYKVPHIDVNAERQRINKNYAEGKITAEKYDELIKALNKIEKRQEND